MTLKLISSQVLDVAASELAIAYARRETGPGGLCASYHHCDWETLQTRPVPESTFLSLKFGDAGARVADSLGEAFSCRAARLPDGGCAVLRADGVLHLFRPNGKIGGTFELEYKQCPAYDIAFAGDLWFTAPKRGAVVQFSLERREMVLRVGGENEFLSPLGLSRQGSALKICCIGSKEVKTLRLPDCTFGETHAFGGESSAPDRFFSVFRRNFVCFRNQLYAAEI